MHNLQLIKRLILLAFIFQASISISSCTDEAARIHASTTDSTGAAPAHAAHEANTSDYTAKVNSGVIKEDTMKGSPHTTAMGNVGSTHIHITYSSPGVKGRVIWGGLVAYDKVWVAGAHQATKINFSNEVIVNGKTIPAGEYAFFTIPGKEKWMLILNKNFQQHLADDYKEMEDVVRIEVTPAKNDQPVQRLDYAVQKKSDKAGEIVLRWENVSVAMPFTTK